MTEWETCKECMWLGPKNECACDDDAPEDRPPCSRIRAEAEKKLEIALTEIVATRLHWESKLAAAENKNCPDCIPISERDKRIAELEAEIKRLRK